MLTTTDVVKIQLQSLVASHKYRVQFTIHNPSTLSAYLDKNEITFTASGPKQNIFVLLTKSAELPLVALEVTTTNLTDGTEAASTMFVRCGDYTGCETGLYSYFTPMSLDTIP